MSRRKTIFFNAQAFGNHDASFKILRDEITRRASHMIAVASIPTDDNYNQLGFLIVDRTKNEAVFTGDGFFPSEFGGKQSSFKLAASFLDIFGIDPERFPVTSFEEPLSLIHDLNTQAGNRLASDIFMSIEAQIPDEKFKVPLDSKPILFPEQLLSGEDLNNLLKDNDESIPRAF